MRLFLMAMLSLSGTAAQANDRPKLAVIDLVDKGAGKDLAQNLTDVLTVGLNELQVLDVLSRADIQQMVAFEQDRQLMGCESDSSCLAELGGALGVALLVTGSVGKVGSSYILNFSLTDTRTVLAREQRRVARAEDLPREAEGAVRFLVRSLLEGRQGYLVLKSSELGAEVEIDGRLVGVTPLARQTMAGGPHRLRIAKKGFITWTRDVDINQDEATVVDAALVPSMDFIADYESNAGTWRTLAYVVGGVGLAAVGFGVSAYYGWNATRADRFNSEVRAVGCEATGSSAPTTNCTDFEGDRRSIALVDTLSIVGVSVGAAALGVAAYLFLAGPEPGLYDQYRADTEVSADVLPLRGGAVGLFTLRGFGAL